MNHSVLHGDAIEMVSLLKNAACIVRHHVVSYDKAAEILTAICTDGEIADRNSPGYDVHSERFGRIEVKSRVLGTDGPFPRISLTTKKLEGADSFMAVRWTKAGEIHAAVMLPRESTYPLFTARLQAAGRLAHIAWSDWVAAKGAIDMTSQFRKLLLTIPAAA